MSSIAPSPTLCNRQFFEQGLPALADALATDQGEPSMASDEVRLMVAHALRVPEIFDRAKNELTEHHFRDDERNLLMIWSQAVSYANEHGTIPTIETLLATITRLTEDPAAFEDAQVAQEILQGDGVLDSIAAMPTESLTVEGGEALVRRFLVERDVHQPLTTIVTAPMQTSNTWAGTCYPAELNSIIRRATERLDQIDIQWGGADSWGPPESLDGPDLPTFPISALPPTLIAMAEATATALQTPVDLPAMLILAACGAAAAKGVEVQVKAGYREGINLYAVVAMDPATRKSPTFDAVFSPLRAYELEQVNRMAPAVRRYQTQAKILESRKASLETRAAKTQDAEHRQELVEQATATAEDLANLRRVVEPRLLADDCTPQKLEMILADQHGRIAVASDEGEIFNLMKGRYSNMPEFKVYLHGWNGADIRTDRVNRESVHVQKTTITVAIVVQPDVIRGLGEKKELLAQGLTARFLYSIPHSRLGTRDIDPSPIPDEVRAAYHGVIQALCELVPLGNPSALLQPRLLTLSEDARERFRQFERDLEPRLGPFGDLAAIQNWAGKLLGEVARISGILHLAGQAEPSQRQSHEHDARRQAPALFTPWDVPIEADAVAAAVEIAEYLIPHAQAAFSLMGMASGPGAEVVANAWHVVRWIRDRGEPTFTRTELQQANRARFPRVATVDTVLDLLAARNIIRPVEAAGSAGRGGRPTAQRFTVNPGVFAAEFLPHTGG